MRAQLPYQRAASPSSHCEARARPLSVVDAWAGEGEARGLTCNGSTVSEHGSRAVDLSAGLARLGACGLASRVAAGASRFAQHSKLGTQRRKDALRTTGGIKALASFGHEAVDTKKPGLPRPASAKRLSHVILTMKWALAHPSPLPLTPVFRTKTIPRTRG